MRLPTRSCWRYSESGPVSGTSPSLLRAAAECVKIIRPAVVYPYHYRERPIDEFVEALRGESDIEVRVRDWYPS